MWTCMKVGRIVHSINATIEKNLDMMRQLIP